MTQQKISITGTTSVLLDEIRSLLTCGICKTQIPYDLIGIELMKSHLFTEHGIRIQ